MIGPEQGKKPGKSGKKKSKAKKAKRRAAAIDLTTPTAPEPGAELLRWIDRVQARVDHLLTLVEPAAETPTPTAVAAPPADPPRPATAEAAASPLAEAWARRQETAEAAAIEAVAAHHEAPPLDDLAPLDAPPSADAVPLTDAPPSADAPEDASSDAPDRADAADDEPFEPGDTRLTAILVARELIARGESAADVRRRLRDGYGVVDPEAVLAQVA